MNVSFSKYHIMNIMPSIIFEFVQGLNLLNQFRCYALRCLSLCLVFNNKFYVDFFKQQNFLLFKNHKNRSILIAHSTANLHKIDLSYFIVCSFRMTSVRELLETDDAHLGHGKKNFFYVVYTTLLHGKQLRETSDKELHAFSEMTPKAKELQHV